MNILIAYYSRTNVTATIINEVVKEFSDEINVDIEVIKDKKNRNGSINYLLSVIDAVRRKNTEIENIEKNPSDYDLLIIGTPVWAATMANPVLAYLNQIKDNVNDFATIITAGSSGFEQTLNDIESIIGQKVITTLNISTKDRQSGYSEKIANFVKKLE
ncbi:MAG: flavodoxin [Methanobrevibacter sp.]|jgi:flavodoxin|nr:flavodoxin [Candidatus Methanoflexus mossambicus]